MKRRSKIVDDTGYTLIEIIIVIVVLGIISGVTFQIVASGVEAFKKTSDRKELYDQGRLALERMAREIRDAKELVECSEESITFKKQHPSQDSVEEIKFWLDDTNTLWRVRNPSTTPLSDRLASNVDSFQVANENCSAAGCSSVVIDGTPTTKTGTAGTLTISHTTGSGSERLMLVAPQWNSGGGVIKYVTGVTYNGIDLDQVEHRDESDDAATDIWMLLDPPTGTHDVVITYDTAPDYTHIAGVMTFTCVDPDTPLGNPASNDESAEGTDSYATVDVPSAAGELVFATVAAETPDTVTWQGGTPEHWHIDLGSTLGAAATEAAGGNPVTMTWTDVNDHWAAAGVSIKPSLGSGGGSGPAGSVVSLELTLSSEEGGTVSMRTMTNMRNVP